MSLREKLRAELAARPAAWRFYRGLRRRLFGEGCRPGPVQVLLRTYARECRDVRFVQVGSCDAAFGDPMIDYVLSWGWRGVMVEPVPHVFRKLRARHGRNPRLTLENVAIGRSEGPRPFYCLEPLAQPPSPFWDQMGSFSREHLEKHERYLPGLSRHIRQIEVPCVTLTALLKKHGIAALNILQIDAEGHDYEVLRSLDFAYCTPAILLFELGHLPRAERESCMEFLEQRGYRAVHEARDCFALHESAWPRWPQTALTFDALAPER